MGGRNTIAHEVVIRFGPDDEQDARDLVDTLAYPAKALWIKVDRIVRPKGETREQTLIRTRAPTNT